MTDPHDVVAEAQAKHAAVMLFNRSRGMSEARLTRLGGVDMPRVRVLEAQVAGLLREREALRSELTLCRALLREQEENRGVQSATDPSAVLAAVADAFGCTVEQIAGRDRKRPLAWARHCAMAMLSELQGQTQARVGGMVGGFHHTTVLHAKRRHGQRMAASIGLPVKSYKSCGRTPERVLRSECRAYAAKVADVRAALGWSA